MEETPAEIVGVLIFLYLNIWQTFDNYVVKCFNGTKNINPNGFYQEKLVEDIDNRHGILRVNWRSFI